MSGSLFFYRQITRNMGSWETKWTQTANSGSHHSTTVVKLHFLHPKGLIFLFFTASRLLSGDDIEGLALDELAQLEKTIEERLKRILEIKVRGFTFCITF